MSEETGKESLLCTNCPLGCRLEVEYGKKELIAVEGNKCKKGLEYAEKEIFHPVRIITTTVSIDGASIPLIPVKTDPGVPKELSFRVVACASKLRVKAPVKAGAVLIEDVLDTGSNLVATRTVEAENS